MCLRVALEVTLLEIPPCQIPMCGVAYSCSYVLLLSPATRERWLSHSTDHAGTLAVTWLSPGCHLRLTTREHWLSPSTDTVGVQRADFGNYVSRPGQVAASSQQDARDTVKWLTVPDVHGDRSTTTAEHVQRCAGAGARRSFSFLHLVVVASSLLALSSGSLLLSERMTVLVSFSRQSQTGVLQLLEPFLLVLGLKKKAPKRMVLKIDRRRVVLLSFFSPGTACNSS